MADTLGKIALREKRDLIKTAIDNLRAAKQSQQDEVDTLQIRINAKKDDLESIKADIAKL